MRTVWSDLKEVMISNGEEIFKHVENEEEKFLYLIMKGEVELCHNGKVLKLLKPGDYFG